MADYYCTRYTSMAETIDKAIADIETKLELIDSTTQTAWLIKVLHTPDNNYMAVVLHKDTS